MKLLNNIDFILLAPRTLLALPATAQAIWDAVAGGNSQNAVESSTGIGTYGVGQSPARLFDNSPSTAYTSRGNISNSNSPFAGLNTGFYVTVGPCLSVLLGFVFTTNTVNLARDPLAITIEASGGTSNLNLGTSWQVIYSGTSGLSPDPGRGLPGTFQSIPFIQGYQSYRILITSKRSNSSNSVSYSKVQLYGRYFTDTTPISGKS